jgi:hypothetical protein
MKIGDFYEVSFNVEAYQSPGGKADVVVAMYTDNADIGIAVIYNKPGSIAMPVNSHMPLMLYNVLGQKITGMSGRVYFTGPRAIMFNASNRASGVYIFPVNTEGNR